MTEHHGRGSRRALPPPRGRSELSARPPQAPVPRRPDPGAAGRRLTRHIAATRAARRQRVILSVVGAMSAITLLVSGGAWAFTGFVNSHLGRVNAGTSGTPSSGPINILVAGVDTRGGLTHRQELRLHVGSAISSNSDSLMLVHIPADHQSVYVVSLPRDSWVNIPGHGMSKINAAYGDGGAQLMVRTVEQATGLTVNDYIQVNFLGFVKVIDALGGVNICVPYAVSDPYSGLHLSAGPHHVDGITALSFARDRHSFAASDLARIANQQQLLSSLFTEATQAGVVADPVRLERFVSAVTGVVKVDAGFDLVRLADELRGLRASNVTFTTVPLATASYITPTGQDAVRWNAKAASALFTWLKKDTGAPRPAGSRPPGSRRAGGTGSAAGAGSASRDAKRARARVSVDVYNGTAIGRLSATTGVQLKAAGFSVHKAGLDWPTHNLPRTMIEYPASQAAGARLLARVLPGAALQVVAGLPRIRLVLGATGHTVAGAAVAGTAPTAHPPPAVTGGLAGQPRTAAQDACR